MITIMSQPLETLLQGVRSRQISLGAGQYLFHLGDQVRTVYIVQSGWVHLVRL